MSRPNVPLVDRVRQEAQQSLAGYYAMIENLDWNVGRVLQTLEETGLADQTILIFFSDHGDMHGLPRAYPQMRSLGRIDSHSLSGLW
ncbi:hypothetical protein CMK14_16205 [Candidatus Poribacteria bacterium]|nr:hypothetical protein [Candidatus Poribacteria bacterium]